MKKISKNELLKSLSLLKKKIRVLVIGDIMLDKYIWGEVSRISPEAPVPVVAVKDQTFGVGGAANVAQNIISLGGEPIIASIIGDDRDGALLKSLIAARGITTDFLLSIPKRATTSKTRIIGGYHQQMLRIDWEDKEYISTEEEEEYKKIILKGMKEADIISIQDYNKGTITPNLISWVRKESQKMGINVIIDPKFENFSEFKGFFLVKPNEKELGLFFHKEVNDNNIQELALNLLKKLSVKSVLVTRGAKGMLLLQENAEPFAIPAFVKDVYDVSGAGDTVLASITLGLGAGLSLVSSALISTYAASIVISKVGPYAVSSHELSELINKEFIEMEVPSSEKAAKAEKIDEEMLPKKETFLIEEEKVKYRNVKKIKKVTSKEVEKKIQPVKEIKKIPVKKEEIITGKEEKKVQEKAKNAKEEKAKPKVIEEVTSKITTAKKPEIATTKASIAKKIEAIPTKTAIVKKIDRIPEKKIAAKKVELTDVKEKDKTKIKIEPKKIEKQEKETGKTIKKEEKNKKVIPSPTIKAKPIEKKTEKKTTVIVKAKEKAKLPVVKESKEIQSKEKTTGKKKEEKGKKTEPVRKEKMELAKPLKIATPAKNVKTEKLPPKPEKTLKTAKKKSR
ncbi:MAG: hypothetical protein JXA60_13180 [Candidatus Coatesbacteria bacterium]|nr:hypothetical protein [Candidatus Coatesbacteria bacterium]